FHNAFRIDLAEIDKAALNAARTGVDLSSTLDRIKIVGEILDYHAIGEEAAVFPAVDKIVSSYSQTYTTDHRDLDKMVAGFKEFDALPDSLSAARATAVLKSHLKIHLFKEDTYLYPLLRENASIDEQESIVGTLASKIPSDKTPILVRWLFPLLGHKDRAIVTKAWMNMMPPQVFSGIKALIKETVDKEWSELTQRVPELT
ncbi:MAG: hemerythrin domain-containing protein, partial [Deltaproteobacteria bacterium]